MNTSKWALGVAIIALVLGGFAMLQPSSGPAVGGQFLEQNHKTFLEGFDVGSGQFAVDAAGNGTTTRAFTIGGRLTADGGVLFSSVFSTTSQGSVTYTAASITDISTVLHTTEDVTTGTLPASTTLSGFIPSTGDRRSIVLVNVGTASLTLAGGTGTLLTSASSTKVVVPGGATLLEFVRKADTDIAVFMTGGSF